jgi:hypothetical protein
MTARRGTNLRVFGIGSSEVGSILRESFESAKRFAVNRSKPATNGGETAIR